MCEMDFSQARINYNNEFEEKKYYQSLYVQ